jgi:hypothetical protein
VTRTGTQTDRNRDTYGQRQGNKGTAKGTQTDMEIDTDSNIDNFNKLLKKIRVLKALSFKKFYKIKL